MNRRRFFLMGATAAHATRGRAPAGPNERVRVAVVGSRRQGGVHIRMYSAMPNVEVAALCDVDESVLEKALREVEGAGKKRPAAYIDYRKLLEDRSIDAVSIATPDHHHALQTIWALEAGKDVYVEKPCSHNMFESRQLIAAQRKYPGRIAAHGTNSRSSPALREAVEKLREGLVGDVYMGRGLCFKWRDTIGRAPAEPVPPGVHYDLWLGPAPKRAFTRNRFHYNWHWFWEYGTGDLGNQGIHELDVARWGLGVKYPRKVSALGGHFMFDDDQETPNTLTALYEFEEGGKKKLLVFEVRHWISNHEAGIGEGSKKDANTIGNIFYGSKGYLAVEGYTKYYSFLGREQQPGPGRQEGGNNWANFIQAVRSRNAAELRAPLEEGAISCVLAHLGNISYRLGRTLHFDEENFQCVGDEEANRMFTRDYRKPFVVPKLA